MGYISTVLLETTDGRLILQQRDNIPTINDPGKISIFGGHQEPGENAIKSAIREIEEETTLKIPRNKLEPVAYFANSYIKQDIYVFIARNINPEDITVLEGQGMVLISKEDDLSKINLAPFARYIINIYWGV